MTVHLASISIINYKKNIYKKTENLVGGGDPVWSQLKSIFLSYWNLKCYTHTAYDVEAYGPTLVVLVLS